MTVLQLKRSRSHFFLKAILRFLLEVFLRIDAQGLEKIPGEGPVIVYINHANWVDPVAAAGLIDRQIAIMGKKELFENPIIGAIFRAYGVFPVDRQGADFRAFKQALGVLKQGGLLVLAPEGHRSGTGVLQEGKAGFVHLALHSGAMLQPMYILGGLPFRTLFTKLKRAKLVIRVGDPYHFSVEKDKLSQKQIKELTNQAMCKLAALMPPELRGVYDDALTESRVNKTTRAQMPDRADANGGIV